MSRKCDRVHGGRLKTCSRIGILRLIFDTDAALAVVFVTAAATVSGTASGTASDSASDTAQSIKCAVD